MSEDIFVLKRNGNREKFDAEKINKVINWAVCGYENVSSSDIAPHAKLKIVNDITTDRSLS